MVRSSRLHLLGVFKFACMTIALISLLGYGFLTQLSATQNDNPGEYSWIDGDPSAVVQDGTYVISKSEGCVDQTTAISGFSGNHNVCVYQGDSYEYAIANNPNTQTRPWEPPKYFLIRFPTDSKMYRVDNVPLEGLIPIPGSRNLIYRMWQPWSTWGYYLYIIEDMPSKLKKIIKSDMSVSYILEADLYANPLIENEHGGPILMRSVGPSLNGRWLAVELRPGGIVRIDMQSLESRWVSSYSPSYGRGLDGLIEFAISDDGRHIAAVGRNVEDRVIEVDDRCGYSFDVFYEEWRSRREDYDMRQDCRERVLHSVVSDAIGGDLKNMHSPSFNYDGGELNVHAEPYHRPNKTFREDWVTLVAYGYEAQQLEYLALGDSYSSGEGDIGKRPSGGGYYLPGTDQAGGCHVSERSYPFLLRNDANIPAHRMKSVACSGARVLPDMYGRLESYFGQGRQLVGLSEQDRSKKQQEALEKFTPGVVPQIEFVKKYKPKVVTLTGGGNDVGFGDILKYCAGYVWYEFVYGNTCDYAKTDSELNSLLFDAITTQSRYTEKLVSAIKEASPASTVYVIGYPKFVSDGLNSCTINAGVLNKTEAYMINWAVGYMNDILESVSVSRGAKYVDTEEVLYGGRLCEGSHYVTGAVGAISDGDIGQSFHPNESGHRLMSKGIMSQYVNMFDKSAQIEQETYSQEVILSTPYGGVAKKMNIIDTGIISPETKYHVSAPQNSFTPGSSVDIKLFSTPTILSVAKVKDDGSLNAEVVIPSSIEKGYHVLTLEGVSHGNEEIRYYQYLALIDNASEPKNINTTTLNNELELRDSYSVRGDVRDNTLSTEYLREVDSREDYAADVFAFDHGSVEGSKDYRVKPSNDRNSPILIGKRSDMLVGVELPLIAISSGVIMIVILLSWRISTTFHRRS